MNLPRRGYSMVVRAEKAAATRQRILEAARDRFANGVADFTLEKVAAASGTAVQTVLRAFGSKEGLIVEAIGSFRAKEPATIERVQSVSEAVTRLFDDYEEIGDRAILMLAEEHRIPGFAEAAKSGRERHRAWVKGAFAGQLAKHPARDREELLVALLAATDVYLWKLFRRDFGLGRKASQGAVERLIRGVLVNVKKRK
jgi:AcrR family transcriptional regulator